MVKREDLQAVGEMAGLVASFMKEYVDKTPNPDRNTLFKTDVTNLKETMHRALRSDHDDIAQHLVPDQNALPTDVRSLLPDNPAINPPELPKIHKSGPPPPPPGVILTQSAPVDKNQPTQLEFSFVSQLVQGYGNVGDVINHFNTRLDKIEDSIRIIRNSLTEIRENTQRKSARLKNENKTTN